ncbi:MAG: alpha/beta hydrolase [Chloroflexi bacterium]|nr:alpha/beta hydrolase [Chloroflexota bacterium]
MSVRRLLSTLSLAALPPIGISFVLETQLRRNLFRTGPYAPGVPDKVGVRFEHAVFWTADGHELDGWLFEAGDLPHTILFMHGTNYNSSDMWGTEERAELFGGFLRGLGCRFLVFDYRGYGRTAGEPTEQGTYLDASAALGYLHNRTEIDPMKIVFYGFSMGTGVAVELALREPSAGLILRAPFTSVRDLIIERMPGLRPLLAVMPWLPLTRFDSLRKIAHVPGPLLVMHGDADETVPYWMGQRLYERGPEPKTFVTFPNAEHQDFPLDIMTPAVREFVERLAEPPRA